MDLDGNIKKFKYRMKGKCNCNKKATSEWLIYLKDYVTSMKFCNKCKPKLNTNNLTLIDGK